MKCVLLCAGPYQDGFMCDEAPTYNTIEKKEPEMFRYIFSLVCVALGLSASAQIVYDVERFSKLNMPVVLINTVDSVLPTCDIIKGPPGTMGTTTANANKVPGRMVITFKGDTLYDSGEYEPDVSGMTIRVNGNTSASKRNFPYKIKLQKKADLLRRDDPKYDDKEWRLLKDDGNLYTPTGFKVCELLGFPWTPRYEYCNAFINGVYQGIYLLCETVKRNTSCLIDVSKTGYIVERDAYWWNEDVYFKSLYFNDEMYGWTFKYPDDKDVTPEQIEYIKECINTAEESITNGTYTQYIDVESFAAWVLAHDILGTWDVGGSNLYMTKYDDTPDSKFKMGPLWDFDSNTRMGGNSFSRYHTDVDFYFPMLFDNVNPTFTRYYNLK